MAIRKDCIEVFECTAIMRRNILFVVVGYKGVWWMTRQLKLMKDVAACDKLRGGGKQPLIRRFPNGETCKESCLYVAI